MQPEITPEQNSQLSAWATQRDAILLEISGLKTNRDQLLEQNKTIASAYQETETQMNIVKGRIIELEEKETERANLVSKVISSLESEKSILETRIIDLSKVIDALTTQKESLVEDIQSSLLVLDSVKEGTSSLASVVEHVIKVSGDNKLVIEGLMESMKKSSQEVVDLNNKNVKATNFVIEKVPAMLVELQKRNLIRKLI